MYNAKIYVKQGKEFPNIPQFEYKGKRDVLDMLCVDMMAQLYADPKMDRKTYQSKFINTITITFESEYQKTVYTLPEIL